MSLTSCCPLPFSIVSPLIQVEVESEDLWQVVYWSRRVYDSVLDLGFWFLGWGFRESRSFISSETLTSASHSNGIG